MSEPTRYIRKRVVRYAYARNGNTHNPTPEFVWEVIDSGRVIDSSSRLSRVKADWPGVKCNPKAHVDIDGTPWRGRD